MAAASMGCDGGACLRLQDYGLSFAALGAFPISQGALTSRAGRSAPPGAVKRKAAGLRTAASARAAAPAEPGNGLPTLKLVVALCGARLALRRRRGRAPGAAATATAPTVPLDVAQLFEDLYSRSRRAARVLAGLPSAVPMMVLSTYSAVPLFSVLAAMVCPRHTRLAQGLAAALGCLLGTLVGAFLAQAKKDAAASAVARLLSQHLGEDMPADELRDLISRTRRRFGVPPLERSSEAWENTSLQEIYEGLLNRFVEVSEFKPDELSLLQRLKEVLELDGIVAGNAHRHAAQLLVSRGYSGLEGEPMKIATDKLLYLSQRIFAEETPQEAARYEMGRLCQVLDLPKKEAAERIRKVAVEYGEEDPSFVDEDDPASSSKYYRVRQELVDRLRAMYNTACKESRSKPEKAWPRMDEMVEFVKTSDPVLSNLLEDPAESAEVKESVKDPSLTLTADPLPGRRLYSIFFERAMEGKAPPEAAKPEEFARILELTEADTEAARIESCQPRLKELYLSCIKQAQDSKTPLATLKPEVSDQMAKFQLPLSAVEDTALEVYKSFLDKVADRVLSTSEKDELQKMRDFLELEKSSLRRMHLKAFAATYEQSVREALGRSGVMEEDSREALTKLGQRLGLEAEDAEKIFYGVIEERLKGMMIPVRDAWEEATYTKEALLQLNKERGKDLGDDPTADGTGGELGIKDTPPVDGVRGFKLMEELSKVADFYTQNKVLKEDVSEKVDEDDDEAWKEAYPVQVGKWIEDKNKEEMFGIFSWNAVTCQDTTSREKWMRVKPLVGGILGLSPKVQKKVLVRMVSRWCNMFIKSKVEEQGELKKDDVSMLTEWAPTFFSIEKEVLEDLVKVANKSLLQNKVLKLLNKPTVVPEDLNSLREEVESWGLKVSEDLELSRPQLRSLFKVEVAAVLEDSDLSEEQKVDGIEASKEAFGLKDKEATAEMQDLIKSRCRACLVNASGDLLQENPGAAVEQMRRLEVLAAFGLSAGVEFQDEWQVAPAMRQKLLQTYASGTKSSPDMRMLERVLNLVNA